MAKVLISDKISESAIQIFKNNKIEVDYKPGISEDELNSIIHDYDGLAIRSATKVTESIIEKAEKKGVDTGYKIIHPFDENIELPLYVANFVLMDYGSGAVFACPAHDQPGGDEHG